LLFLSLIIFNLTCYGQDTLAVVSTKFTIQDTEAFFLGDTVLVRIFYEPNSTTSRSTLAGVYSPTGKIGNLDLGTIGKSRLPVIKQYGNIVYLSAYEARKNKTDLKIYKSESFGPAALVSSVTVAGVPSAGFASRVEWHPPGAGAALLGLRPPS